MNYLKKISVYLLFSVLIPNLLAADYYVATNGNDSNPGSLAEPWLTIQHAADNANAGDTVNIRGGTYEERITINVSGAAGSYITFQNYNNEDVYLDGSNLTPPDGDSAMIWLENKSYLIIKGLEIRNYRTSDNQDFPIGIAMFGSCHHIEIRNNYIHHIEQNTGQSAGSANALAVYGNDGINSANNITIDSNTISECKTGDSETMTLNGNVEEFTVTNNTVHDCNNIGIDAIGWEGTAAANDQARNGTISGNTVYNITSFGNPAYGNERSAGGIYVDGGKDITIEHNTCYQNDLGIEVACEHSGKTTSGITVRNNLIYSNNITGIAFGGYDSSVGSTENCTFIHNTLFKNDTTESDNGELMIQKAQNNTISHNIIYCRGNDYEDGVMVFSNWFSASNTKNNTFDYNIYYTDSGKTPYFVWQNSDIAGFNNFQNDTGQDTNSKFADPKLADTSTPDLHIQLGSPALDKGDPAFFPATNEKDIDGDDRVINGTTDIGADEYDYPVLYTLTVNNGSGSGNFAEGTVRTITADNPAYKKEFQLWTGDTANVDNVSSSTTTISMPAADTAVTATYQDLSGKLVSMGSVISISAADVGLVKFYKKPKVYALYDYTDNNGNPRQKKFNLKVLTKVPDENGAGVATVNCEWKKKITIYDKKGFAAAYKEGTDADTYFSSNYQSPLEMQLHVFDSETKNDSTLAESLYVMPPHISSLENESGVVVSDGRCDDIIVIKGEYFSTKYPKVYLETLKNGKIKKFNCKRIKYLPYDNSQGKPNSSCMDPITGASEIKVQIKPRFPSDWDHNESHNLVIDNKLGIDSADFNTTP